MSYSNNCYSSNSNSGSSSSNSNSGGYTFYSNGPPTISYTGLSNYSCSSYPSNSIYGSGGSTYSSVYTGYGSASLEVDFRESSAYNYNNYGGSVSNNHIGISERGISDNTWNRTAEFLCDQVDDENDSFNNFLMESQGGSKSKKKNQKLSDFANQRSRDKGKFTKK
jgi:hypothetical protein